MTDFKLPDFNEIERQRALKMKNTLLSPLQLLSRTPNSIAHFILFLALFKICVEAYPASPIPAQPRSQFAEFCTTPLLSSVWNHAR